MTVGVHAASQQSSKDIPDYRQASKNNLRANTATLRRKDRKGRSALQQSSVRAVNEMLNSRLAPLTKN